MSTSTTLFWRAFGMALTVAAIMTGIAAQGAAQGSAARDRTALEALYDATGGRAWHDSTN